MTTFEDVEKAHAEWVELQTKALEAKAKFDKAVDEYNALNSDDPLDEIDKMLLLNLSSLD